jgi:hypothetical protein
MNIKVTLIGLMLAVTFSIAGCGGEEGDKKPAPQQQSSGPGLVDEGGILCEAAAVLFGGTCVGVGNLPNCSDDVFNNPLGLPSCDAADTSGLSDDSWITPTSYGMPDTEPNNSISTPAMATLNSGVPKGRRRGFHVNGMINSASDSVDVFVFTLTHAANIDFSLCFFDTRCQNNSGNRVPVDTAYIDLLDQYGDVIWTATENSTVGNLTNQWLEAGVPYYLMIVGADTMGSDLAYRLRVVEAQSQTKPVVVVPPPIVEQDTFTVPELDAWLSAGSGERITIDLNWIPPTANADGSPFLDLAGYVIYFGLAASGEFTSFVAVDDPDLFSTQIELENDEWMFAITAVHADGLESEFSNVVIVQEAPPADLP